MSCELFEVKPAPCEGGFLSTADVIYLIIYKEHFNLITYEVSLHALNFRFFK